MYHLYHSLDHLMDLAKKTGDRLIIHDSFENESFVIMDIEAYERLVLGKKRDVRELSSGELLDQINRDIGIWRANKEMEERWEIEETLGHELEKDRPSREPFDFDWEKDATEDDWQSAGDVIKEIDYKNVFPFDDDWNEENEEKEADLEPIPFYDSPVAATGWREESLPEEEPVFYEEPIG